MVARRGEDVTVKVSLQKVSTLPSHPCSDILRYILPLRPTLSREWKTRELRHVGIATESGPMVCAKLMSSKWRDVGIKI